MKHIVALILFACAAHVMVAQNPNANYNKFKQLDEVLPTPNVYRNGAGAPGHEYWQQRADYEINIKLEDETQRIYGEEWITYHNNSPDNLEYLWLQLDQNVRSQDSESKKISTSSVRSKMSAREWKQLLNSFDGGFKIEYVISDNKEALDYTIVHTMMRIDLPTPLKSGESTRFNIKWWYNINNRMEIGGRSGYEYFEQDDNYLYTIAQFYPRMCMYNDVYGWQNKQFLGRGEFTLEFGDFDVSITVPDDHVVGATGTLQNPNEVLTKEEQNRLKEAQKSYEQPVIIVTQEEAEKAEADKSNQYITWRFKAENVRDFGFASSRKFIWDAMSVKQESKDVMAMSLYPKEGNPLWERYSTKAVAHTLKWYSHYTFDYPYPVAYSVHAARIGMEYPMICFNFGRPEKDGTYSERIKYGMISVIIHEVGHNYFPMIVNSDERQWTWMDEGLNSFLQYLAEQQWERNYPSRRGPAYKIVEYMKGDKSTITPIMTNSESLFQFGNNAYGKPATALNILRETILGRDLFDYAFKTYSNRWKFKHPTPSDFFRTMEDASGIDLDWFWRSWFYTTDHVDIGLKNVQKLEINLGNPDSPINQVGDINEERYITNVRNQRDIKHTYDEIDTSIIDFYTFYDPLEPSTSKRAAFKSKMEQFDSTDSSIINSAKYLYQMDFELIGGIPMPIILGLHFADGTFSKDYIPAEIWRFNQNEVSKIFILDKELEYVELDPNLETADINVDNNQFPPQQNISRFELYKQQKRTSTNAMQQAQQE
jgi:hypothetical protein